MSDLKVATATFTGLNLPIVSEESLLKENKASFGGEGRVQTST